MKISDYLLDIFSKNKRGEVVGLTSICSATQFVLEAALEHSGKRNMIACFESTGQQVNQYGGYAGMQPKQFADFIRRTAQKAELGNDRVILGADHLGPGPWRFEPAKVAMAKARELTRQCVCAGYRKLHLDPSMPCRDDVRNGRPHISLETMAERTASLCETAEAAAKQCAGDATQIVYVVGSDVPPPGGEREESGEIPVSSAAETEETIRQIRRAFLQRGLESAWDRCVAIVVQTGAAFGPEKIWEYESRKTKSLKSLILGAGNLVFEAHSTDFQTEKALTNMLGDHFAILKAGPCLTFAMREALYALSFIERELLGGRRGAKLSRLPEVMREIMTSDRTHWRNHYRGDASYLRYLSAYGFSDRIRYFWSNPRASEAVAILFDNMTRHGIPLPLLSQFMPAQFEAVRKGRIRCTPKHLIYNKIAEMLERYANACGGPCAPDR